MTFQHGSHIKAVKGDGLKRHVNSHHLYCLPYRLQFTSRMKEERKAVCSSGGLKSCQTQRVARLARQDLLRGRQDLLRGRQDLLRGRQELANQPISILLDLSCGT
jgi:hypothetical protein